MSYPVEAMMYQQSRMQKAHTELIGAVQEILETVLSVDATAASDYSTAVTNLAASKASVLLHQSVFSVSITELRTAVALMQSLADSYYAILGQVALEHMLYPDQTPYTLPYDSTWSM